MKIKQSNSSCSICIEKFKEGDTAISLPCHHKFHQKCLKPWFKDSVCCPNCRLDIKKYFNKEDKEVENYDQETSFSESSVSEFLNTSFLQPRFNQRERYQ